MKRSKILGPAGSDNYRVENMPVHLPKENMNFFYFMQDNANEEPFSNYRQYGNAYHDDWQERPSKPDKNFAIRIMEAIETGLSNALNEKYSIIYDKEHSAKYKKLKAEREALEDNFVNNYLEEHFSELIFMSTDPVSNALIFKDPSGNEITYLTKVNTGNNTNFSISKEEYYNLSNFDYIVFHNVKLKKSYVLLTSDAIALCESPVSTKFYSNIGLKITKKLIGNNAINKCTYIVLPISHI